MSMCVLPECIHIYIMCMSGAQGCHKKALIPWN